MMMKRRFFVLSACAAALVVSQGCKSAGVCSGGREYVELKTYVCSSVEKRDALLAVFDKALVPALNRQGIGKVGVFWTDGEVNDGNGAYATQVFVLVPHRTMASFVKAERLLLADPVFMRDAAALFTAPMADPLYDSCSSSLFRGFETCPAVERVTASGDRLFQLRIYNSYTPERNVKKVAMFEEGGEIAIFRKCGLAPVFFGEALAGDRLANLTYMLGFPDKEAKDTAWKTFREHPEWLALKADPQYKDTANKITNIVLRPSAGSQL